MHPLPGAAPAATLGWHLRNNTSGAGVAELRGCSMRGKGTCGGRAAWHDSGGGLVVCVCVCVSRAIPTVRNGFTSTAQRPNRSTFSCRQHWSERRPPRKRRCNPWARCSPCDGGRSQNRDNAPVPRPMGPPPQLGWPPPMEPPPPMGSKSCMGSPPQPMGSPQSLGSPPPMGSPRPPAHPTDRPAARPTRPTARPRIRPSDRPSDRPTAHLAACQTARPPDRRTAAGPPCCARPSARPTARPPIGPTVGPPDRQLVRPPDRPSGCPAVTTRRTARRTSRPQVRRACPTAPPTAPPNGPPSDRLSHSTARPSDRPARLSDRPTARRGSGPPVGPPDCPSDARPPVRGKQWRATRSGRGQGSGEGGTKGEAKRVGRVPPPERLRREGGVRCRSTWGDRVRNLAQRMRGGRAEGGGAHGNRSGGPATLADVCPIIAPFSPKNRPPHPTPNLSEQRLVCPLVKRVRTPGRIPMRRHPHVSTAHEERHRGEPRTCAMREDNTFTTTSRE